MTVVHEAESQIEMGMKVEAEHRDLYDELRKYADHFYRGKVEVGVSFPTFEQFRLKIVLAHLREDPLYYTHLMAMETASDKSMKARHSKRRKDV